MRRIGTVLSCRVIDSQKGSENILTAEIQFKERIHAEKAVTEFNKANADGRILKAFLLNHPTEMATSSSSEGKRKGTPNQGSNNNNVLKTDKDGDSAMNSTPAPTAPRGMRDKNKRYAINLF